MVFDLSSKGYNQNRISAILHVSQALVSLDLAQLRKDAANSMKSYLEEKLPLIYQECYEGISQVISRCWEMINDVNTPTQTRVQLLALVAEATQSKLDISCGGEVIENGIKYAKNVKSKFVEIARTEDILTPAASNSNSDSNNQQEEESTTKEAEDNNNSSSSNNNNNNTNDSNSNNNNNNNNNRRTRNSVF
jgi:predicted transcriptional regulator